MPTDELYSMADRVHARLEELGISQSEIARRAGFQKAYLSDLLRGKKKRLHRDNYWRLATALGLATEYLVTGEGPKEAGPSPRQFVEPAPEEADEIPEGDLEAMDRAAREWAAADGLRIPVYRAAPEGRDGAALVALSGETTARPFCGEDEQRWYAVAMPDDTMAPRFEYGELVYALEDVPARPRDDVVIRVVDSWRGARREVAYVRRLLRMTPHEIIVGQLAPFREQRFVPRDVTAVDRIVLSGDPDIASYGHTAPVRKG